MYPHPDVTQSESHIPDTLRTLSVSIYVSISNITRFGGTQVVLVEFHIPRGLTGYHFTTVDDVDSKVNYTETLLSSHLLPRRGISGYHS